MSGADVLSEFQVWWVSHAESFARDPDAASHHRVVVRRRVDAFEHVPDYPRWQCDCTCGATVYNSPGGVPLVGVDAFVMAAAEHLHRTHRQVGALGSVSVEDARSVAA